ncbi:hypothetical protein BU17DRAFT_62960 [Hysterangium stoloniferum]|nr:hypothetical protein BU17DRAFT_62960 [Hysterangium stoloniferum]
MTIIPSLLPHGPMFRTTSPTASPAPITSDLGGFEKSLQDVEMQSFNVCDKIRNKRQADTQMEGTYKGYQNAYEKWWNQGQWMRKQENPSYEPIPAFPIIASKVVLFLKYEMDRPQYERGGGGKIKPGTNVGKSVIKGAISALESYRKRHQHLYPHIVGSQVKLRDDIRIREIEQAAAHNEPNRHEKSQTLKASGAMGDTYSTQELIAMSSYCLTAPSTKRETVTYLRDRAMFLLGAASAYRGDSLRPLEWSDLGVDEILNTGAGLGSTIMVWIALILLSYNAKHNQDGRLDEKGVIRHWLVELCPIGALAMHFFGQFHILGISRPSFKPDFSENSQAAGYGIYGRHHLERVKSLHKQNDISISKATHATRIFSAETARGHGTSAADTKALGGWNDGGSFRPCYDHKLPVAALLGAAMFNAAKPEMHFLAREILQPPEKVLSALFPWADEEIRLLRMRATTHNESKDFALKFRAFAEQAPQQIRRAEEDAHNALQQLPECIAETMRLIMASTRLAQEEHARVLKEELLTFREEMFQVNGRIRTFTESDKPHRPRKRARVSTYNTSNIPSPPLPHVVPQHTALQPMTDQPFSSPSSSITSNSYPPHHPSLSINITNSPNAVITTSHMPSSSMIHDASNVPGEAGPESDIPNPNIETPIHPVTITPSPQALPGGLALNSLDEKLHITKWQALFSKFTADQIQAHHWDYDAENLCWLPHYSFSKLRTYEDAWIEWAIGINGCLPVRVLYEHFSKPAWHRSVHGTMTEAGRRQKLTSVIEKLANKPQWSIPKALEFLKTTYGQRFSTPGTLARYLSKGGGANTDLVFATAATYRK